MLCSFQIDSITIQDPSGIHMKQWQDVPVHAGIVITLLHLDGECKRVCPLCFFIQ